MPEVTSKSASTAIILARCCKREACCSGVTCNSFERIDQRCRAPAWAAAVAAAEGGLGFFSGLEGAEEEEEEEGGGGRREGGRAWPFSSPMLKSIHMQSLVSLVGRRSWRGGREGGREGGWE